jgi:hypothetical protein
MHTNLRSILQQRDDELARQAASLIATVKPLLWHSLSTFPAGTKHTHEHTDVVEEIAAALLSQGLIAELNNDEVFLLTLACHFHDLGMAAPDRQNRDQSGRDQARREHAIAIGDRIRQEWRSLGFKDEVIAVALAEVCRGHRPKQKDGHADWSDLDDSFTLYPFREARIRLLSALIFAADELHLGADRAPHRDQEWLQIEDAVAMLHWSRHQAIQGPTVKQGQLRFSVSVVTEAIEDELRRTVFQKAFSAVRDLKRQMQAEGISSVLPELVLDWRRDSLWELYSVLLASDMKPRLRDEHVRLVLERFSAFHGTAHSLTGLCEEAPPKEMSRDRIERVISDMETTGWLVPAGDLPAAVILSTHNVAGQRSLDVCRKADKIDTILKGFGQSVHEFDLYRSEFGKRFIMSTVAPTTRELFGVDITTESVESPLCAVLEKSPTAFRTIAALLPFPTVMVKRDELAAMLLASSMFDLSRYPDLILDSRLRHAAWNLATELRDRSVKFLRFIEELSLSNGLSFEQLGQTLVVTPDRDPEAGSAGEGKSFVQISVTQTVPHEPGMLLARILIAGQRADVSVELLNAPIAPLTVTVKGEEASERPVKSITFGRSTPTPTKTSLRGHLSVDLTTRVATFTLHRLGQLDDDAPFIVGIEPPLGVGELTVNFTLFNSTATIKDLASVVDFNVLLSGGDFEIRVEMEDGRRVMAQRLLQKSDPIFNLPFSQEILDKILKLPPTTPIPWFLSSELISLLDPVLDGTSTSEMSDWFAEAKSDGFEVTSVTLRLAHADGTDFREEFLGFLPRGIRFKPPRISGTESGGYSQEQVNQLWDEMKSEFLISSTAKEDFLDVAHNIRDWCRNPNGQFPLRFSSDPKDFHTCRTGVELTHRPRQDRGSYFERPVFVRLRPLTALEQRQTELEFWSAIGDSARAELAKEIISRLSGGGTLNPSSSSATDESGTSKKSTENDTSVDESPPPASS